MMRRFAPTGLWLAVAAFCAAAVWVGHTAPAQAQDDEAHEAESGDHAAEGGEHAEHAEGDAHGGHESVVPHGTNLSPAELQSDLAIATFVVFLLLLIILWKFAWTPIVAGLDKRESRIAEMIQQAEDNAAASQKQLAEYEAQLARAHEEIREMLDTAHREADAQKQEILAEAQKAAAAEKERALREIGAAKDSALGEIAKKSVDEAFSLAGKIVRRELKPDDHSQLVQEALQQFPSKN